MNDPQNQQPEDFQMDTDRSLNPNQQEMPPPTFYPDPQEGNMMMPPMPGTAPNYDQPLAVNRLHDAQKNEDILIQFGDNASEETVVIPTQYPIKLAMVDQDNNAKIQSGQKFRPAFNIICSLNKQLKPQFSNLFDYESRINDYNYVQLYTEEQWNEQIESIFQELDVNNNNVLDEMQFRQFIDIMIERFNVTHRQQLYLSQDEINQLYKPFERVYKGHRGITIAKLQYAIQVFKVLLEDQTTQFEQEMKMSTMDLQQEQIEYKNAYDNYDMDFDCNSDQKGGCLLVCMCCCYCGCVALTVWLVYYFVCANNYIRPAFDKQNGFINDNLKRSVIEPRPDFDDIVMKDHKLFYWNEPALNWSICEKDTYWNEQGQVEISQDAEKEILEASWVLHNMALEAVDIVVKDPVLLRLFGINQNLWPAIKKQWIGTNGYRRQDFQGRFDFSYDGKNPPKMLEYNADTASLLLESGAVQERWFRDKYGSKQFHQSNYLDTAIKIGMDYIKKECDRQTFNGPDSNYIGFISSDDDDESYAQMLHLQGYMNKTSSKSKIDDISTLKLRYRDSMRQSTYKQYTDGGCLPYYSLWKYDTKCIVNAYPKEWMITEIENDALIGHDLGETISFEPFWKVIVGNKALLPLLWSLYPDHPNLLPAYFDDPKKTLGANTFNDQFAGQHWVSKPLFGREGQGVFSSKNFSSWDDFSRVTEENFGRQKSGEKLGQSIYQLFHKLPEAQGRIIQAGSWIINGMPAGLSFREGKASTFFEDANPFLPHIVTTTQGFNLDFQITDRHKMLRHNLYNTNRPNDRTQRLMKDNIYSKSRGTYKIKNVLSYPKTQKKYSSGTNLKYKDWPSYKTEKQQEARKNSLMQQFTNEEILMLRQLKCFVEYTGGSLKKGRRLDSASENVLAYIKKNPKFLGKKRKQKFGYIALLSMQNTKGGKWFSVDRYGLVRIHYMATSGRYAS